ncbi:hypothetical protein H9P43_005298 [Blastocladiella emersonii ATCC 22665]|nr:hypothetical protein H9P43_005281 [Blastocladiella emersonii ATCC 22665]KAI9179966.1 hypothetical protein H9P43_005298 [Blastocladiella emersonii ATCC 22665]
MTASSLPRLLGLALCMFLAAFGAGHLPLSVALSERSMQLTTVFGAGMIVGTALVVILPEGVETLLAAQASASSEHADHDHDEEGTSAHRLIGTALLLGFATMFLIEQAQAHSAHVHPSASVAVVGPPPGSVPLRQSDPDLPLEESPLHHEVEFPESATSPHPPRECPSGEATAARSPSPPRARLARNSGHHHHYHGIGTHSPDPSSDSAGPSYTSAAGQSVVAATIGLVIHSFSDGVAMGAASAAAQPALEMVVFLAIVLHKGPSAFGLTSYLLHHGTTSRRRIRHHLLAFSAAAPLAAITTFLALRGATTDSKTVGTWTGLLLLFSAGSFLYVATVHVLPEVLARRGHLSWGQVAAMMVGMLFPLVIQVDHAH